MQPEECMAPWALLYRYALQILPDGRANHRIYRQRFQDAGIVPGDIKVLDGLRRIPILTSAVPVNLSEKRVQE